MNPLLALAAATAISPAAEPTVSPAMAMDMIQQGNQRYVAGLQREQGHDAARRAKVAANQTPHPIIVTCADSRVSPELLFDQGLGDLFVIRVAGNVVDTHALASIEYAAEHLGSRLLVVMGHERCGAVSAAIDAYEAHKNADENESTHTHNPDHDNLNQLLNKIMPAVEEVAYKPGDFLANAIDQNVKNTLVDCWQNSPILRKKTTAGQFQMVGAVYDLDTGRVTFQEAPEEGFGFVRVHK